MSIVFSNVDKNFGLIDALQGIDFTVKPGEFIFLFGPSGAGKSTVLKLILSQMQPTSGQVTVSGSDLATASKKEIDNIRRKIGVVFQDYQLIPDKSLEENIALSLDIISYPKDQIQPKIDQVIKQVNLDTRRLLYPSQLSGGELQRAALARALAIEPEIILADEPTGNLDQENSKNLVNLLQDINQKHRCTIIMATHDKHIVDSLAKKRVINLYEGKMAKTKKSKK